LLGFVADGFDDWLAANGLHPHSFWFARKLLPDHAHRYNFFIYHEFRRHLRQQQSENQFGISARFVTERSGMAWKCFTFRVTTPKLRCKAVAPLHRPDPGMTGYNFFAILAA
jgi:hypothetical protein